MLSKRKILLKQRNRGVVVTALGIKREKGTDMHLRKLKEMF
jgi:hypothetical protein